MNEQVDYENIDSRELQAFVKYDFVDPVPDFSAVLSWCVKNDKPELYVAYMENYPDEWLSTEDMDANFRNRFLSTMPLGQRICRLAVTEFNDKIDSEAVAAILSDSALLHLNLVNSLCSEAAFELLMSKLAINTRLKSMEIQFYGRAETFPIIKNIKWALEANATLELLVVKVPLDHGEQALLAQLALDEPRFRLDITLPGEVSDDSDDSDDSEVTA